MLAMKKVFLFALILFFKVSLFAQGNNYHLKFDIKGLKDTTIFLANYYGQKLYYADTTQSKNGLIEFKGNKKLNHGMFALVLPEQNYFEFVFAENEVHMKSNIQDVNGNMQVVKSNENKIFYEYINFLNNKRQEVGGLKEQLTKAEEEGNESNITRIKEQMESVDKAVKDYQRNLVDINKGTFVSNMIRMNIEPELPETPLKADGSIDSTMRYVNYKNSYFDNIDFSDPRLVRTPVFHNKLDYFFNKIVLQTPDSVIKEADKIISRIPPSAKDMYQYVVHHITYTFETSKVMGMDRVFVHMALNYYDNGKAHWLSDEKRKKVVERAKELAPLLVGEPAHPLTLMDSAGNWSALYDIKADYTILIFWDPDCGHCKKQMPKYAELYKRLKPKSVEIYGVSSSYNDKWRKFIREKELNFINVGLPQEVYDDQSIAHDYLKKGYTDIKSMNFRTTFDIYATPKVFVLDKDKKIIAKQLDAEQIEDVINRMVEGKSKRDYQVTE
jgi:peroxiredoxin